MKKEIKINEFCEKYANKKTAMQTYRILRRAGVGAVLLSAADNSRTHDEYRNVAKRFRFNPNSYKYAINWILVDEVRA